MAASPVRRRAFVTAAVASAVAGVALLGMAVASSQVDGPSASFEWSLPERYGMDADGDRLIDYRLEEGFLQPSSYTITLDACATTATDDPIVSYAWSVDGAPVGSQASCTFSHTVPSEGAYDVRLTVTDAGGGTSVVDQEVKVEDLLVVSLGDSVASGEGNPDWLEPPQQLDATLAFDPLWQLKRCHRTAMAGPAQAAYRLEKRDPHTSVTFVHLACSGATITDGIVGPYAGIEDADEVNKLPAQLEQMKTLIGTRPVDALLVSVGANDVKFSSIVKACLNPAVLDCSEPGLPDAPELLQTAKDIYDANVGALPGKYDTLQAELAEIPNVRADRTFITQYFDPATDDLAKKPADAPDDWTPTPTYCDIPAEFITAKEMQWASQYVVAGLNAKVQASAAEHGWNYVDGIASRFQGHGYCASDRWIRTIAESLLMQGNPDGPWHPNWEGHVFAYGPQIEASVAAKLSLGGTPIAPPTDANGDAMAAGIQSFFGALDQLNSLDALAAELPFAAERQKVLQGMQWFNDMSAKVSAQIQRGMTSPARLDAWLDDPDENGDKANDGVFEGALLDVHGEITPHRLSTAGDVKVTFTLRGNDTSPFSLTSSASQPFAIDGGALESSFELEGSLAFRYDLTKPTPEAFYLLPAGSYVEASFDADATFDDDVAGSEPVTLTLGIAEVEVDGSASASGNIKVTFQDPNADGKLMQAEWGAAGAAQLFAVEGPTCPLAFDLSFSSALAGLDLGTAATATLEEANACDGTIVDPAVQLHELQGFTRLSIADVVNALAQLSQLLRSVQQSSDLDMPFVQDGLAEVIKVNDRLNGFFVELGVTDPANPMSTIDLSKLDPDIDSIGTLLPLLRDALGMPDLQLAWDPATDRLTFPLSFDSDPAPKDVAVDLGDQLARAGIRGVTSAAAASVDADLDVSLGVGLDLSADAEGTPPESAKTLLDRLFIETGGVEIEANASVAADLSLDARIGFVQLEASDSADGPVTLLAPRDVSEPMLGVDLVGPDGRLTLSELVAGLTTDPSALVDVTVNAQVPTFGLEARAEFGDGTLIGSGRIDVAWTDVTEPSTFSITPDGSFNDSLLKLDFDPNDPRAMGGMILDAIQQLATQLEDMARNDPNLSGELPVIGVSIAEMADAFGQVKDVAAQLVALNSSLTLQTMEQEVERALAQALGITEAQAAQLVAFAVDGGTLSERRAVTLSLDFGVCSAKYGPGGPSARPECDRVLDLPAAPFSFDLGDSGLASVGAEGVVDADYIASGSFDVGIELPRVEMGGIGSSDPLPHVAPGEPPVSIFIADSTHFTIEADLDASMTFDGTVGPIRVSVGKEGDLATAKVAARAAFTHDVPGTDRVALADPAALTSWLGGVVPTSVPPAAGYDCGALGTDVAACASLPVYLGDTKLATVRFAIADLLQPDPQFDTTELDALWDRLAGEQIDWELLIEGVRQVNGMLADWLAGETYGVEIPIVGGDLAGGAQVLQDFDQHVLAPLEGFAAEVKQMEAPSAAKSKIETFLLTNLSGAIADRDGGGLGASDLGVELICDDLLPVPPPPTEGEEPAPGDGYDGRGACVDEHHTPLLETLVDARLHLTLGRNVASAETAFDIGFPGLQLRTDDTLRADLGWSIDLRLGIDRTQGFYLLTDAPGAAGDPELEATLGVHLPGTMEGDLAHLPITITDEQNARPDLSLDLGADLSGGDTEGRLLLTDLLSGTDFANPLDVGVDVTACADVRLGLRTGKADGEDSGMPGIGADFVLGWGCDAQAEAIGNLDFGEQNLTIGFQDVQINLGSFVNEFLKPVVKEVQRVTKPMAPVVDTVMAPVPGLEQLAGLVGQPAPTWFDAFEASQALGCAADGSSCGDLTFLRRLFSVIQFANAFPTFDGTDTWIEIGDFALDNGVVQQGTTTAAKIDELIKDPQAVNDLLAPMGAQFQSLPALQDQAGFSFPAFSQPTQLFQLLLGKDVTLVEWNAGALVAEAQFSAGFVIPIGPVPVTVYVSGSAGVDGRFVIGYDTFGIRRAYAEISEGRASFGTVGTLFQGVYLNDLDAAGGDPAEIALRAELVVGASTGVPLVSVGIEGGVGAGLDLNLADDGDGRMRIEEIWRRLSQPICIFDVTGKVDAFIRAFVELPFAGKIIFPIVSTTLVDLGDATAFCSALDQPPPPELAGFDEASGVLTLNVGPRAALRHIAENIQAEKVTVRQIGAGTVTVSGFGTQNTYGSPDRPVTLVQGDAASGTDSLVVATGSDVAVAQNGDIANTAVPFTIPVRLCGGGDEDTLTGGEGGDVLLGDSGSLGGVTCPDSGDPGNDRLSGRGGDDLLGGGGADDTLGGDGGTDGLWGGDGVDAIFGGAGGDDLHGDGGDDVVQGGPELDPSASGAEPNPADTADGGDGDDLVNGGYGGDALSGGNGGDTVSGDAGDDTLGGGEGDDPGLRGGPGNDTVNGDGGHDDLYGDAGSDTLDGGAGGDDVIGGPGADVDTVRGGDGDDILLGDDGTITRAPAQAAGEGSVTPVEGAGGNDVLEGGAGGDIAHAQAGDDRFSGGAGEDTGLGGTGADTLDGDDGADTLSGEAGDDLVRGGAGGDTAGGGEGVDTVLGGNDADVVRGGHGNDLVEGNGGDDALSGDLGDDRLVGGGGDAAAADGADVADGGDGNDAVAGDNATLGPPPAGGAPGAVTLLGAPAEGGDTLRGGNGHDRLWGQGGDDGIDGGTGEDVAHGNAGDDALEGGEDDDRLAGGSATPGAADGADTVSGGPGEDGLAGDNAGLAGTGIELHDRGSADAAVAGGDTLTGGAGEDRAWGQAGGDTVAGGDGADDLWGNEGSDGMVGDGGDDRMVGGSSDGEELPDAGDAMQGGDGADVMLGDNGTTGTGDQPDLGATGVAGASGGDVMAGDAGDDILHGQDGDDTLTGGGGDDRLFGELGSDTVAGDDGADHLLGDQGTVTAATSGPPRWPGGAPNRSVELVGRDAGGSDDLSGGVGDDHAWGGAAGDLIRGGAGDDRIEGNGGGDTIHGMSATFDDGVLDGGDAAEAALVLVHGDQDDIVGGSGVAGSADGGDTITGDAGNDVVAGDNAVVTRSLTSDGSGWSLDPIAGGVARTVVLLDLRAGDLGAISGADTVHGGTGSDRIHGQDGDDRLSGGPDDDHVQGNGGLDLLRGDATVLERADAGTDGQDDLIGGSTIAGHRDGADTIEGDGAADFILGDNGTLTRSMEGEQVATYGLWSPDTRRRQADRFDVGGPAGASGSDTLLGGGGDDFQWGQDGDDVLRGGSENDVVYGELGADELFGEAGQDALVGDRGYVASQLREAGAVFTNAGEPAMSHRPFAAHPLDRRVDLLADGDGDVDGDGNLVERPGLTSGGNDYLRGGPDHDVVHGAFGDDLMNGDSGGDHLFGADGSDVMWGGKGNPDGSADRGTDDRYVDHLYGGYGGSSTDPVTGGADLLDFRPRPTDPASWHRAVAAEPGDPSGRQHSQGIDWLFGGFDRDVLQGDVSDNGPNQGDRLMDWTGAYNLYTHCSAAYGGYNDVRQFSPSMQATIEQLAHAHGLGTSLDDLRTRGSSGWRVLGMITKEDTKSNGGSAYPETPGSFTTLACEPDAG